MVLADFNADGAVDLALVTPQGELVVLLSSGELRFHESFRCPLDVLADGLYVGDVNGDGSLDLAIAHGGGKDFTAYYGRGDGTFSRMCGRVTPRSTTWSLTTREIHVARLASEGYTCTEIAQSLRISRRTVESHIDAIRSKLDLKHKRDLVNFFKGQLWRAIRNGTLTLLISHSGPTIETATSPSADLSASVLPLLISVGLDACQMSSCW